MSDDNEPNPPPIYIRLTHIQSCSDFNPTTIHNNEEDIQIGRSLTFRNDIRQPSSHFTIEQIHNNDFNVFYNSPFISRNESYETKYDDPEKSKSSDNTDTTIISTKLLCRFSGKSFNSYARNLALASPEESPNTIIEEWNIEDPTSQITSNKSDLNKDSFANLSKPPSKKRFASLANIINNLFENPEGRMKPSQRIAIFVFTAFEAYRTLISSFLTVFVPQNCGGYSCTIMQNLIPKDNLEKVAISINAFMALYFCGLFATERIREDIIKNFLIPDKTRSTDKDYLIQMLSKMTPLEQKNILQVTRAYRRFAQFLLLLFFVNASISCVVIRKNFLNNTTITVFITNTFFMINRIYKTLKITSSGEYNIYSAYRTDSLLYNRYRGEVLGGNS